MYLQNDNNMPTNQTIIGSKEYLPLNYNCSGGSLGGDK
jgi:hypothetical protein